MDSYHLSIVKLEGLSEVSNSYLYIYSGLNILRVLTLDCFDIAPVLIPKGTLRFVIEDSHNSFLQACLSFKSDIFTREGFHWLPLFQDSEKTLTEVPEDVGLPRILIDIHSNHLSPVQEITEESETFEEVSESSQVEDIQLLRAKNIGMSVRIMELEDLLESQKASFDQEIEAIKQDFNEIAENYEKNLLDCKNKDFLIEEMKASLNKQMQENQEMQEKILAVETELKTLKNREISFIKTLEQKDLEIFNLKEKKKSLEFSSQGFLEFRGLSKEDEHPQILIKKKIASLSTNTLCSNSTDNEHKPFQTASNDDRDLLIKKLYNAEVALNSFKLKSLEELDLKIKKFLTSKKIENCASLCNELTYNIGNTKVVLFSKADEIYCKAGGLVKKFDYFIKNQCYQDIENFKKKLENSQKRLKTTVEIDKIASSIIHKTFDTSSRAKSSTRLQRNSQTPLKRSTLSPSLRSLQQKN